MWGCLKFVYEAQNQTMPDQITLNWTMQIQTASPNSHVYTQEDMA